VSARYAQASRALKDRAGQCQLGAKTCIAIRQDAASLPDTVVTEVSLGYRCCRRLHALCAARPCRRAPTSSMQGASCNMGGDDMCPCQAVLFLLSNAAVTPWSEALQCWAVLGACDLRGMAQPSAHGMAYAGRVMQVLLVVRALVVFMIQCGSAICSGLSSGAWGRTCMFLINENLEPSCAMRQGRRQRSALLWEERR